MLNPVGNLILVIFWLRIGKVVAVLSQQIARCPPLVGTGMILMWKSQERDIVGKTTFGNIVAVAKLEEGSEGCDCRKGWTEVYSRT